MNSFDRGLNFFPKCFLSIFILLYTNGHSQMDKSNRIKMLCTQSIVYAGLFCYWNCVQMMERHQNLLYEEENERVPIPFNSQTPVPRLISRLGEREGNAMLNEKKRDGRKNPLPFIWYGNISRSHTRCGYENKQLGDGRDRGKRARKGRARKPTEMYRVICFSERGGGEKKEWRVGRWRKHRGRKERWERRTYHISLLNSSPAAELKSEMWWGLFKVQKEKNLWYVKRFGAQSRRQIGRQPERQVVRGGRSMDIQRGGLWVRHQKELKTDTTTNKQESIRTNRNMQTCCNPVELHVPKHSPVCKCECLQVPQTSLLFFLMFACLCVHVCPQRISCCFIRSC